ncbi:hypothetical protein IV203_012359 [Nitzschia inconspicua]|uniref:Calcineurin-like phosphoesterase domain-containing protein n=1 Tax=Nitzschia inconspicua TaxID=303405 RepID=A0A9K3KUF1_9STRA|nr:hypothetical protein IV203_012359 [Nitzschia inconspicua]
MADEEPPSLGRSAPSTPSASAFGGSGTAPPSMAFSHNNGGTNNNNTTPPSDDLNRRWKQYEQEMETRRSESALTKSANSDSGNYKLPDAAKRGVSEGGTGIADYSVKRSTSYDTNELIRKYAGVTGIPPALSSGLPRPSSFRRTSSSMSQSSAAVREEALQVLDLVDEHLNAPFSVRRTESGGFRAHASSMAGGSASTIPSSYSVRRTESGTVMVEHEGTEDEDGAIQPYYVKRTASGTVTSGRGPRRTPAALSGLGLSESALNNSRTQFKSGRYSFSDPKFREDDYLAEDEDDIIGPSGTFDENDPNVEVPISPHHSKYRDDVGPTAFDGDFPRGSSAWSSRYTDNPIKTKLMLDDWDQGNYGNRERQSARNMFMSTASSMRDAANNVGGTMTSQGGKVFGAGFSFRQSHTFGNQKDNFNLRTMWNDGDVGDVYDDQSIQGTRNHKTWQQVMLNKKRRRRIGCSILCFILAIIALAVGLSTTKEQRTANKSTYPGHDIGSPVTFYATCDTPYNAHEEKVLQSTIATLPEDGNFFVHLGNLQDAAENSCPPSRMYEMATLFLKSPIPFINVPGDQDWVKCTDQALAFSRWLNAFEDIDENFSNDNVMVRRSENNPELFVFNQNGVLFFGLHLVNGPILDLERHDARMRDMAIFFLGMLNFHKEEFRAIVILGNARPGHQQHRFFESVSNVLERIQTPVVYVHADSGLGDVEYTPIEKYPFIHGIQVPNGGKEGPLKISVGFGNNPFVVG